MKIPDVRASMKLIKRFFLLPLCLFLCLRLSSAAVQLQDLTPHRLQLLLEVTTSVTGLASSPQRGPSDGASHPQRLHQRLQAKSLVAAAPAALLQLLPQVQVSVLDLTQLQQGAAEARLQLGDRALQLEEAAFRDRLPRLHFVLLGLLTFEISWTRRAS